MSKRFLSVRIDPILFKKFNTMLSIRDEKKTKVIEQFVKKYADGLYKPITFGGRNG